MLLAVEIIFGFISMILHSDPLAKFYVAQAWYVIPFIIIAVFVMSKITANFTGKNSKIIALAAFFAWLLVPNNTWRQIIYNDKIANILPSEIYKYYEDNMYRWKFKNSFMSRKLIPNYGYYSIINKIAHLCFVENKASLNPVNLPKHQKGRFAERETLLINAYNAFLQSNYQDAYRNLSHIKINCKPAVLLVFQYICAQKIGENWKQNLQPDELERLKHALINDEYTKLLKGELEDV